MGKIGKVCTIQERKEMLELLSKYIDVIGWSYEDLKTYDPKIIVHFILLKCDAKPFH